MDVARMLPSQKKPILDQEGLWYVGREGVMFAAEVGMERIIELMKMAVRMLPSQEEPIMDQGGLWYARGKGVMNIRLELEERS